MTLLFWFMLAVGWQLKGKTQLQEQLTVEYKNGNFRKRVVYA